MQRLALTLVLTLAIGCGGSPTRAQQHRLADSASDRDRTQQARRDVTYEDISVSTDTGDDLSWLNPVYFELDSSELLPATRDTLARLHDWLAAHSNVKLLTIEGHCDEHGTDEYNVALGQRRAQAIVDYLTRLGTETTRLNPISYGSFRPAVEGHDEVAWAKNRRGEFRVGP